MDKLEKAIKDLNEIKSKIIPVLSRMYGSGFSSVFACEKVEEKLDNALELLKEQKNLIDYLVEDQVKKIDEMEELLKEKQSVKPTNDKGNFCCGSCGNPLHTAIINPMIRFCDHCGRPVDWKDGDGE